MRSRQALSLALRDLYGNSWRLVTVNAALGFVLVLAGTLGAAVHLAFALVVLAGPVAAALAHCAVVVVRTGNLSLRDALDGLHTHWRRGLLFGAVAAGTVALGAVAVHTYAASGLWPLVFLTLYVLAMLAIYGLVFATVAVAEPDRPLRASAREAAVVLLRRPGAGRGLGFALLLVNLVGIAAAVMPFLTLTLAYSFVAAARFALPQPTLEEPC
jgi:hypothetical protein